MATLERAIAIAAKVHEGQFDKAGAPYILHPLRVMLACRSMDAKIAGVLHDVVEDSGGRVTLDDLRAEGFSEGVVAGVEGVTKREEEKGTAMYMTFVTRASQNPISREAKRADLIDNLDVTRLAEVTENDRDRLAMYAEALQFLDGLK